MRLGQVISKKFVSTDNPVSLDNPGQDIWQKVKNKAYRKSRGNQKMLISAFV